MISNTTTKTTPAARLAYENELVESCKFHYPAHAGIMAENAKSIYILGWFSVGSVVKGWPHRDHRTLAGFAAEVYGAGGRLRKVADMDGTVYYAVFRRGK